MLIMITKNDLLINLKKSGFFFKKKAVVLFICMSLAINGFIPSASGISKYSLIMILAAVTQNAASIVFSKCNDSLVNLSSKIYLKFQNFILDKHIPLASSPKKESKEKDSTASNNTLAINQVVYDNESQFTSFLKENFIFTEKLFKLNMNYKISDTPVCILIVFLIFLFSIRQRKCFLESLSLSVITRKIKISA